MSAAATAAVVSAPVAGPLVVTSPCDATPTPPWDVAAQECWRTQRARAACSAWARACTCGEPSSISSLSQSSLSACT
eukprot:1783247-Prymnesium_polylepis.1